MRSLNETTLPANELKGCIDKHDERFKNFLTNAHKGFAKGVKEHGEGSNEKMDLIKEAQEELRDSACYCYFLFEKLERVKRNLKKENILC